MSSADDEHTQLDPLAGLVVIAVRPLADTLEDVTEQHGRGDFLVGHEAARPTLVDRWSAAVLPVEAENLLHPGLFLVNEPLHPQVAVKGGT